MTDYRTPLPHMFAGALEAAINRVIGLDTDGARRMERLNGRHVQLVIEGLGIELFLTARHGVVHISADSDATPDTVISGSPFALFAMAAPGELDAWGLPHSRVHISGDANLARDLERVFTQLDPDWEGQLSVLLGDVMGFQLSSGLRQGANFLREAARKTADMTGAYLRDDHEMLVRPEELKAFGNAVNELDEALNELESRLNTLADRDP